MSPLSTERKSSLRVVTYYRGLKGSLGGHLSILLFFLKQRERPHSKAAVATVTVPQGCRASVGWEMLFSRSSSSSVNEELAGSLLSTTGTRCFLLGTILKANTSSVEKTSSFSRPLNCVSKLFMRKKKRGNL